MKPRFNGPEELEYWLAENMPWDLRWTTFQMSRALGAPLLPSLVLVFSAKARLRRMILSRAYQQEREEQRLRETFILDEDGVRGARDKSEARF